MGAGRWGGRLVRHPLLHFLIIGLVLFTVYRAINPEDDRQSRSVTIDAGRITWLADTFENQFGHRPSPVELGATVKGYIADELRYREGLAMGLDRDDSVVRRRIIQKYDFINAPDVPPPPAISALQKFWQPRFLHYAAPATISFCQAYIAPTPTRAEALNRTRAVVARLAAGADVAGSGDAIDLPECITAATASDVARDFGSFFAQTVFTLPVGRWSGPVESGLGFHAVHVTAVSPPSPRSFEAARADVLIDWQRSEQLSDRNRRLARLRDRYQVEIDNAAMQRAAIQRK